MTEQSVILSMVNKFFERDLTSSVHVLESMSEEEAAAILSHLPVSLSVRVIKALQISYAATLLKTVDDDALIEAVTSVKGGD